MEEVVEMLSAIAPIQDAIDQGVTGCGESCLAVEPRGLRRFCQGGECMVAVARRVGSGEPGYRCRACRAPG